MKKQKAVMSKEAAETLHTQLSKLVEIYRLFEFKKYEDYQPGTQRPIEGVVSEKRMSFSVIHEAGVVPLITVHLRIMGVDYVLLCMINPDPGIQDSRRAFSGHWAFGKHTDWSESGWHSTEARLHSSEDLFAAWADFKSRKDMNQVAPGPIQVCPTLYDAVITCMEGPRSLLRDDLKSLDSAAASIKSAAPRHDS